MKGMEEIRKITVPATPVAGVRRTVPIADLPATYDASFHLVMDAVLAAGAHPVGPPYGRYRGMPTDTVDVEMGFPIDRVIPPAGDVLSEIVPERDAVQTVHVGPYDAMRGSYDAVFAWIGAHALAPTDEMWEIYETDPSANPDAATWRTQILVPVRTSA